MLALILWLLSSAASLEGMWRCKPWPFLATSDFFFDMAVPPARTLANFSWHFWSFSLIIMWWCDFMALWEGWTWWLFQQASKSDIEASLVSHGQEANERFYALRRCRTVHEDMAFRSEAFSQSIRNGLRAILWIIARHAPFSKNGRKHDPRNFQFENCFFKRSSR